MPNILAFAGSARQDSLNKKLIRAAVNSVESQGGEATLLDLRDYPMPLYDGDLEASDGIPPQATELYNIARNHQGLIIACPEYNSSITPLLKNTIDWLSRPRPGDPQLAAFQGKVAALLSASPGALGGLRGLVHVRAILQNIGTLVIPNQVAVPQANKVFGEDGTINDEQIAGRIERAMGELLATSRKLFG